MNVTVVGGAGYVGLITSVGLAAVRHRVTSVDLDDQRIEALNAGRPHVVEAGLPGLLTDVLASARLRFSTSLRDGADADVVLIAVGTPSQTDGRPDLSHVLRVAESLSGQLHRYTIVAVRSTVPVGTVELIREILSARGIEGRDFDIVANPEFLREGKGLEDFFYPDRIVIGASLPRAAEFIAELYEPIRTRQVPWPAPGRITSPTVPVVRTDVASAQMIKYAANAFLAMRISFINEIAGLCEHVGADVRQVQRGLGFDPRIGRSYLDPGLGFGGPCLEKDLRALVHLADDNQYEPAVLRAVLERNARQLHEVIHKVKRQLGDLLYRRPVAVFGLAFKAGTNDVRFSTAVALVESLIREGAAVRAYDPAALGEASGVLPSAVCVTDPYEAADGAEALIIATEWEEFRELDFAAIHRRMARPLIVDARNLLDADMIRREGFEYIGMGMS